jgi:predicted dehydrogenase
MTIKVGIIGCGAISEFRHAPEYYNNPHAEIVALFDPKRSRAQKLADAFGGKVVDDYKEILLDPNIDAVSDCSPNNMHHIITTEALEAGKHVLCEKPFSITLEGARTMIDASEKSGKTLMVAHNQRLASAHRKAREILDSDELGRVITFNTIFGHKGPEYWSENKSKSTWFFDKNASRLGVAGDLGIHKIDVIRYLLNDEIAEIGGFMGTLDKKLENGQPIDVCDNLLSIIKMKSGAIGTLSVSWTYYGPENNCTTIYCEKGIIKIYGDPDYQIIITKENGDQTFLKVGSLQTNDSQSNSFTIDAFIDSIRNHTTPPVTGEDGYQGMKIVLAAMESSEKGTNVKL